LKMSLAEMTNLILKKNEVANLPSHFSHLS
jgi:hypothetical protein